MDELPLFPLDTVLFPGTPIHLHIFEPCYRLMINACIESDVPSAWPSSGVGWRSAATWLSHAGWAAQLGS